MYQIIGITCLTVALDCPMPSNAAAQEMKTEIPPVDPWSDKTWHPGEIELVK